MYKHEKKSMLNFSLPVVVLSLNFTIKISAAYIEIQQTKKN